MACWLVTDARPAFGFCFVRLLITLLGSLSQVAYPGWLALNAVIVNILLQSAVLLPILLPAAWLLFSREKAPGPLPYPEPVKQPAGTPSERSARLRRADRRVSRQHAASVISG